jgi:hypothetical protein
MTGINSFNASYKLNYRDIWNKRLDSLKNYLKRMTAGEKKNNHS